jgi:large subunit ribosomal protein L13
MLKRTTYTKTPKKGEVKRSVVTFDAKKYVLGRLASEISSVLQGKNKTNYMPHLEMGDYVVVINAAHINVTGRKEDQKIYTTYSGYQGGLKEETLAELRARHPEELIRRAVSGMLPNNKLREKHLTRLFITQEASFELPAEVLEITK